MGRTVKSLGTSDLDNLKLILYTNTTNYNNANVFCKQSDRLYPCRPIVQYNIIMNSMFVKNTKFL